MPRCCKCMSVGLCKNCSCARAGTPCTDCYPLRVDRCCNHNRSDSPSLSPSSSSSSDESSSIQDGGFDEHVALPSYTTITHHPDVNGFIQATDYAYSRIIHWRSNIFKLPSGNVAKKFLTELTRLFRAFIDSSEIECCAIKATMILPALMLQNPHAKSKAADHRRILERRLSQWADGDIHGLVIEGETIQTHLPTLRKKNYKESLKYFSKLMRQGQVTKARRALSESSQHGVLQLDHIQADGTSVLHGLENKHPIGQSPSPDVLLQDSSPVGFHPIMFDSFTADVVKRSALRTFGAAGPSGVDSWSWRRFCSAFGKASSDLCNALASFGRRICSSYVDPKSISAYTASRLIPLDKNPGIRPIGVAEVCRRILGKAILSVCKYDIITSVCPYQLCAGIDAGCEAAFHAMKELVDLPMTQAALFVDATNAFNNLNRSVTLRNLPVVCPALAPVLINTYREPSSLVVGGKCLLSREGTTQGDPLAMAMYALGTIPLIDRLKNLNTSQIWYADDSAACGTLIDLKSWWLSLSRWGPSFGYFPNNKKTTLFVKSEYYNEAINLFHGTNVRISTEGAMYLGGPIGSELFVGQVLEKKISEWCMELSNLSRAAAMYPHESYACFTHGITSSWNYLFRIIDFSYPSHSIILNPLESAITTFISALTASASPGDKVRDILSLPTSKGGLGIVIPRLYSLDQHKASKIICNPLVNLMLSSNSEMDYDEIISCISCQKEVKTIVVKDKRKSNVERFNSIYETSNLTFQRSLDLASEKGASIWLTSLPIDINGFALNKTSFRDALCLRYGWPFTGTPSHCVCGNSFTLDHLLSCPTGGFPSIRHNEVRDITANLLSEVCHNVSVEPGLQPLTGETLDFATSNTSSEARLDIAASGVYGSRFERDFFDVRVFNPYASSNTRQSLSATYKRHEDDKKRQYQQRVQEIEHASFSPLVFSTTGGVGKCGQSLYKRIASMLSEKNDTLYSLTINLIRCKLNFALLRSSILCIRGSRSKPSRPVFDSPFDLQHAESRLSN